MATSVPGPAITTKNNEFLTFSSGPSLSYQLSIPQCPPSPPTSTPSSCACKLTIQYYPAANSSAHEQALKSLSEGGIPIG